MSKFRAIALLLVVITSLVPVKASAEEQTAVDKVVVQVDENDPKIMNLALNNVQNLLAYEKQNGKKVQVEIVTYGPGLNMLRADTSPVKDRISALALENPDIQFSACGNTLEGMTKHEGKKPPLVSEAKLVPAGIARIVELEKQGYAYIRP
ncbi:MAG: hypothetical protein WBP94_00890 [Rhodomicrobiaceae bacterium]